MYKYIRFYLSLAQLLDWGVTDGSVSVLKCAMGIKVKVVFLLANLRIGLLKVL